MRSERSALKASRPQLNQCKHGTFLPLRATHLVLHASHCSFARSVLGNWAMEFKKWCPAFNVISYFGDKTQRGKKRQGWTDPGSFHVMICSYNIAVTDERVLKRKQWEVMVLDEAHQIKNFKSMRWNTLLGYNTRRRILLTGTPLQNNIVPVASCSPQRSAAVHSPAWDRY